ncbi:MAG: S46 family peptidase [Bacteroidetes bacterium]|nr:S46 family peptidase [Bacteroidota bacterium]
MKRFISFFLLALGLMAMQAKADEGMWIPKLIEKLNMAEMQRLGLKLSAEQIYSETLPSLKDAIVIFGRGCTGEVISDKGLILTNHHCGYGAIQSVSTVENDYLRNGFWANSFEDEIPINGLTVTFVIRMEDVTDKVLQGISSSTPAGERAELVRKNSTAIEKAATEGTHYTASVSEFFEGNAYYLLVYEVFRDVRLVGTPPESIGKFGADTDNWMWPRHTGDFAIFRVYAGADNKPAAYSKDNKPYKPRHFLPIAVDGVKKDDFAMIMGNPGSTDRYLTSWGVRMAIEETNPTRVKIRAEKLRIMDEGMEASPKVRLQYASKYAGVSNYWKYFIGQTRGLKRLNVIDKKLAIEADFKARMASNPEWQAQFGQALPMIEQAYGQMANYNLARWYMVEAIMSGSEILNIANRFGRLQELLGAKTPDNDAIAREIQRLRQGLEAAYKNYDLQVEKNMLARMLEMYYQDVPAEFHPALLTSLASRHKQNFHALAEAVFARSAFATAEKAEALLSKPSAKAIANDPAFALAKAFNEVNQNLQKAMAEPNNALRTGNRLFVAGLMAMYPERTFYPNANRTMRLTYGTVQDYFPADAVHYNYVTTTKGILEKEDPSTWEFEVPEKLKTMILNGDYGMYGNPDGSMTVNFLTNHDITGGNSGSPVLDAQGRLIGLAFDGNWEAMSGDIAYEAELQRTISVDIRYVLLIVDKFAGARHIMNELLIVKDGLEINP